MFQNLDIIEDVLINFQYNERTNTCKIKYEDPISIRRLEERFCRVFFAKVLERDSSGGQNGVGKWLRLKSWFLRLDSRLWIWEER